MAIKWEWKLADEFRQAFYANKEKPERIQPSYPAISCLLACQWIQLTFAASARDASFTPASLKTTKGAADLLQKQGFPGGDPAAFLGRVGVAQGLTVTFAWKSNLGDLGAILKKFGGGGRMLAYLYKVADQSWHVVPVQLDAGLARAFDPYQGELSSSDPAEVGAEIARTYAQFEGFALLKVEKKAEAKVEAKTETKPGTKGEVKPETKPAAKPPNWEWKLSDVFRQAFYGSKEKPPAVLPAFSAISSILAFQWIELTSKKGANEASFTVATFKTAKGAAEPIKAMGFPGPDPTAFWEKLGAAQGLSFANGGRGKLTDLGARLKSLGGTARALVYLYKVADKKWHVVVVQSEKELVRVFDPFQGEFSYDDAADVGAEIARLYPQFEGIVLTKVTTKG